MKRETAIGIILFLLFWPAIWLISQAGDIGFYIAVGIVLLVIGHAFWSRISDGSHQGRPEDGQGNL